MQYSFNTGYLDTARGCFVDVLRFEAPIHGEAEDDEAAHFLIGVERVRALVALVAVRAKSRFIHDY